MCSLMVKETVNYYLSNDSNVYSCCVDLSKAFDRVKHDKLFQLLIDRKVPGLFLRIIMDMYEHQTMRTVWNKRYSNSFETINGVRQGGIISPILFCVYVDTLLKQLETDGIGCWVRGQFYGAIGYADDLKLLSPNVKGLKHMLEICERFGQTYGVKYNPTKTVCILYAKQQPRHKPRMKLCGHELVWVNSVKHLGHVITCNLSENVDIRSKKCDLFGRVNTVLSMLGNSPDCVLRTVFSSQCAHLYGTVAWDFTDKCVHEYVVAWNRSVRRIFNLPPMTHTRYLPHVLKSPGVLDQIYGRFIRMCQSMEKSDNSKVNNLFKVCMSTSRSIIRRNLRTIEQRLKLPLNNVLSEGVRTLKRKYIEEATDCDKAILNVITELRETAKYLVSIPGFSHQEICDFINFVCTF